MDFIKTWKEVILKPSDFYRRMPTTGGYTGPLIFTAICFIINSLLFMLVRPSVLTLVGMNDPIRSSSILSILIIDPIFIIITVLLLALVYYLLYKLLGGTGTYEGTVRLISYASAPAVFIWIPIIGPIIGVYDLYIYIVGGMIVHNVSMKKSIIAVLPFVILSMFQVRYILSRFAH